MLSELSDARERARGVRLVPTGWDELPGWEADHHAAALAPLRRTAEHVAHAGPHRTGALGVEARSFGSAFDALARTSSWDSASARSFFETHFAPCRVDGLDLGAPKGVRVGGVAEAGSGFVTGFYEPVLAASIEPRDDMPYPILAKPRGLVRIDGDARAGRAGPNAAGSDDPAPQRWAMRAADGTLSPPPDRATIELAARAGALPPEDWPVIAWAESRIDLFFAQVQGAARLALTDGSTRRITYAAKTGHPFTGIGGELVRMGELPPDRVTMTAIRTWLADHPGRAQELLCRNRSYIFFREAEVPDADLGPVAAARVPLTPGRSLAVDRLLHTFGTPVHVSAPNLRIDRGDASRGFHRLMIAQETGSAIIGAGRGDIFTGSGHEAGETAGAIAHPARFTLLVPKPLVAR